VTLGLSLCTATPLPLAFGGLPFACRAFDFPSFFLLSLVRFLFTVFQPTRRVPAGIFLSILLVIPPLGFLILCLRTSSDLSSPSPIAPSCPPFRPDLVLYFPPWRTLRPRFRPINGNFDNFRAVYLVPVFFLSYGVDALFEFLTQRFSPDFPFTSFLTTHPAGLPSFLACVLL